MFFVTFLKSKSHIDEMVIKVEIKYNIIKLL